ncbi:glycosyltransferase [Halorhodospira sp. M38]|uniref:glycosyltransferase n=1 Tax=unclassified Halorhodospira TaxID=2626748 RepID=UPI003FCE2F81
MITVTYVVSSLPPSGPTTQLLHLLHNLERDRFTPSLIVLSPERSNRSVRSEIPSDVTVHSLNLGRLSALGRGPRKLYRILKELDPQIVHTSGARPDSWVSRLTGQWCHLATIRNDPAQDYPSRFGALPGRALAFWHLRALRRLHKPVTCSSELARLYSREYGISAQAIRNGVDTNYYRPGEEVRSEQPGFVWVGSLIPRKEPNLMLDAFQQAFPREVFGPSSPHLSILGDGPLSHQLASEADHSSVCLTGAVDNPLPYYQTASWFVSTSRSEGLPNAVLEALACGVPALLSDIPAHREIAEYAGEAVRLVPEQGTDAWAEALQTAASDPHLPERRHTARKAAEQHFSARATAQQYMALYEDLVQQGPKS